MSDSVWREHIGNLVPPDAATAIGEVMGTTLLLARSDETFVPSATAIWGPERRAGLNDGAIGRARPTRSADCFRDHGKVVGGQRLNDGWDVFLAPHGLIGNFASDDELGQDQRLCTGKMHELLRGEFFVFDACHMTSEYVVRMKILACRGK
jgi:hypothetical protein